MTPDSFTFASDMAGLLAAETPELDLPFLSAWLRRGMSYFHDTRTFYKSIRKLARAHALTIDSNSELKIWRYWDPSDIQRTRDVNPQQQRDQLEQLTEILDSSVKARLRSAYPVGSHLSGGLDCSSVAVIAQRVLNDTSLNLNCYSWSPPPNGNIQLLPEGDERKLIDELASKEALDVYYSRATLKDRLTKLMQSAAWKLDSGYVHELDIRRHAADHDVRLMLSGWGGDELISFNGRGYPVYLLRSGQIIKLLQVLKKRSASNRLRSIIRHVLMPMLPDKILYALKLSSAIGSRSDDIIPDLYLKPDFMAAVKKVKPLPRQPGKPIPGANYQLDLLQHGHITHRIEQWASGGGRSGMTYAYPLLDKRVIEFALSVPPERFIKRQFYRDAVKNVLPDSMRTINTKGSPAWINDTERLNIQY